MEQVQLIQMPSTIVFSELKKVEQEFFELFRADSKPGRLILDFAGTSFIDSSGVIFLRKFFQTALASGIDLIGWSISPRIREVLIRAQLERFLYLAENTEAIARENPEQFQQLTHPSVVSKTKRILDITGAIVGLGITSIAIIPIAILIKLDSPGPVLFSQSRCGYRGKTFRIWKFRSMVADAPKLQHLVNNQAGGAFFKNSNDPRVTRIGRFLRKTSLDELPQFWNVLVGDMSLVGTRPPTLAEVEQYEAAWGKRLDVKPGLTGEWQVNGRSKISDFTEVVRLDLQYQKNWSVLHDLRLIAKTLLVIFGKNSGAC